MKRYSRVTLQAPAPTRLLCLVLLLPALFASCGSVFQGPVFGRIALDRPDEAVDAVVFLRCRGAGIHGEVTTDDEHTRVRGDGSFAFLGSLTFPTTERCYLYVRHPRYQTARVDLAEALVQTLEPITLTSWDTAFSNGPDDRQQQHARYPWPQSEVYGHLLDTLLWLQSFAPRQQREMARYIPVVHAIYRRAWALLEPANTRLRDMLRLVGKLEEGTGFAYPFSEYLQAVKSGDADKVAAFIAGGVLRETGYRGQSSALSIAAAGGHLDVIDVLLAHDEPLHIAGCGAPLLAAVGAAQWPAALQLIGAGAAVDSECQGRHPLGDALARFARHDNLGLLGDFLAAGVPVDTRDSTGTTALAAAAANGKIEAVKLLLAAGADPRVHTAQGVALLEDARAKGYLDVERELRLAAAGGDAPAAVQDGGETISLPWRRGDPSAYTVHSSYGHVNAMVPDPDVPGVLWLATQGGLLRVNPQSGEQRGWTRVNGLPAGAVRDIGFAQGYLWVATGAGLARMPLPGLARVETVGGGEPHSGFASGFIAGQRAGDVWYQGGEGLYRLDPENSRARRFAFEPPLFAAVAVPGSDELLLSNDHGVWRFDPVTGQRRLLVDSAALAAHVDAGPPGPPLPRALALEPGGRTLWIGSHGHGLFRLDMGSGAIGRLALTAAQIERCARSTVAPHVHGEPFLAGGTVYAQLERCFGRVEGERFVVLGDRVDVGPVEDARGDVWWLHDDRFHRRDARGDSATFARAPDPLGNARVNALHRVGERLFVGVEDAPLAVRDLADGGWTYIRGVTNVQALRTVAAHDDLLALGQAHYYWVDPHALTARELVVGPGSASANPALHWRDLRDLEFDGETLWVLRDNRQRPAGKSRRGLYRVSRDSYKSYDAVSGYALGVLQAVVQDPAEPDRLWLLQGRDGFIDFDKTTDSSVLIRAGSAERGRSPLRAAALADPRRRALTLPRHEALDPDEPELVWGVRSTGVYVRRGNTVLRRWPAQLPVGRIEVVRTGAATTVWLASSEGLIEFPVPESWDDIRQEQPAGPQTTGTTARRAVR